jgi:pentapeptide MXKDX repeat protein
VRRFVTTTLSLAFVLGLTAAGRLVAQDEKKKEDTKASTEKKEGAQKDDTKKDESKKDESKKEDAKKEAPKAAEAPLPSIPPEVEAKLEAARKAVAEAVVAAQDAGLVETTIDPPPILDILVTGRATDARDLKAKKDTSPEVGLSPEVFGAWFTGYGKMDGITAEKNVRIVQPSKGLIDFYSKRAAIFSRHIAEARKAKGEPAKKDETKPAAEPKKDEVKTTAEPKKDEAKTTAEPKKDEAKPKEEAKKEETNKR